MATKRSGLFYEGVTIDFTKFATAELIRPPIPPKPTDILVGHRTNCTSKTCGLKANGIGSNNSVQTRKTADPSGVTEGDMSDSSSVESPTLHRKHNGVETENRAISLRRQGGIRSRVIGQSRSGTMSRGLQELVAASRDSQAGCTGSSRMNGLGSGYENALKARESLESNGTNPSFDSDDLVEDNPAYRTVSDAPQYDYATVTGSNRPSMRSSSGSSDVSTSNDGIAVYLDLLDDTEDDPEADPDDIYEYCWNSDEFSDGEEQAVYDNADVEIGLRLQSKRRKVMEEIVSSESTYIDRLFILLKTSFHLEGANALKSMYPANQHNQMFPSIEALFRLHAENILPSLRNRLEHWSHAPEVVDIWQKYLPFLSIYKQYASMFAEAVSLIQKHKKSSEDFANLIKNSEKRGEFRKLSLENFMLEPVQRIARYKLLLEAYSRSLRPDDEEREPLRDVIETIDRQIRECQQLLSAKEVLGNFQKVQDRLDDMLSVLSPTSKLLKEGGATEVTVRANRRSQHQRYLFLFSDFVLICSKKLNGKYSISLQLDSSELRIRRADDLVALGYSSEVCMLLKGRERIVSLVFQDSSIKDDWEEMFLSAITVQLGHKIRTASNKRKAVNVMAPSGNCAQLNRAPVWIKDESAAGCMICEAKFKKVVRTRHHCRGCGIVVCHKCCSQKMALPYMENEVKRVCDNCFLRGREITPELTRKVSMVRRHRTLEVGDLDKVNLHRSQAYGAEESET